MSNNNIGEFFVSLGLQSDTNSFRVGQMAIEGTTNAISRMIGTARNVAAVMGAMALSSAQVSNAEVTLGRSIGVTAKNLDTWRIAAKTAGASAEGLISSMTNLEYKMQDMRRGKVDQGLAENLAWLGLNFEDVVGLDADERVRVIMNKARDSGDQKIAQRALEGILGADALKMYNSQALQGMSLNQLLAQSAALNFTDQNSAEKAAIFGTEWNAVKGSLDSLTQFLGSEIAEQLTPAVSEFKNWLVANGDDLKEKIANLAEKIGTLVVKLEPFIDRFIAWSLNAVGTAVETTSTLIDDVKALKEAETPKEKQEATENIIDDAITGVKAGIVGISPQEQKTIDKERKDMRKRLYNMTYEGKSQAYITFHPFEKLKYNELDSALKKEIDELGGKAEFKGQLKDGVIRPNGQITQVAPDDWVFAARNIGDLARAFLPSGITAGGAPGQYVINQTFNVTGSNDIPATIRQQAYRGTQDGLMQVMQQTQQRLQLMPGLQ